MLSALRVLDFELVLLQAHAESCGFAASTISAQNRVVS